MRRIDSRRRTSRALVSLWTAGLALVLVVALSPILRALPVGGSAYYAFLGNISILGIPLPLNFGPAPVATQPAGGGTDTQTSAGIDLGIPITGPTVFSTGAIEAHTEGDPATDSTLSRATGGQADLFPVPLTGATGLLRIGGFELECQLNPTSGLTSHAAMGGAESALLPNAIDNALWASPPPNSGMTINGLGEVFWHVVEKEQTATETIYKFDGVRIALDASAIPAGGATGEFIWGHVECSGTRPIPESVTPSTGPAGTTVTITGTGFIDGALTSVDFAGIPATDFTVVSDTEIQATVPELRGGSWAVSVTTHVDRGTLPDAFTSPTPLPGSTVGGSAFGASLQLTPAGLPIGDVSIGPVPLAELPEGGGSDSDTLEGIGTEEDGGILGGGLLGAGLFPNGLLFAGAMTAETEGSGAGVFMRSEATAAGVDIGSGLLTFDGATVTCELNETSGELVGTTSILGLSSSAIDLSGVIDQLALNVPNIGIEIPGLGAIVFNEQIASSNGEDTLTVRGLRVTVSPLGVTLGELIFLEANCAVGPFVVVPTIASIDPPTGPTTGGTEVTITGTAFQAGATVNICGQDVTPTSITATEVVFTTPSCPDVGPTDVIVSNPDGGTVTLEDGFAYQPPGVVPPTVSGIEPSSGPTDGGTEVTVTGTEFQAGATVTICGQQVTPTSITETQVVFITPACSDVGPTSVTVTNPDEGSATSEFTYMSSGAPTIDPENGISPPSGPVSGGTVVIIKGTNFVDGMEVTFDGVPGTDLVVHDSMTLEVTTPPAPSGSPGPVDVTVTTTEGSATATDGFTYTEEGIVPPDITDVSPENGGEGDPITIDGENFQDGAVVIICGQEVAPDSITPPNQIIFTAPACPEEGPQDVTVCNPDGGCDTEDAAFTYGESGNPTSSTVDPNSGSHAGGTEVIIIGTDFVAGAQVTFGGGPSTDVEVLSPTVMRVVTPPSGLPSTEEAIVDVAVATPAGTSVFPDGFTYEAEVLGPPTIDDGGITPPSGPVSGGTLVTVTGTNFVDVTEVTFGGEPGSSLNVLNDTTLQVVTPPGDAPGPVDVTVTTSAGSTIATDGFTYIPDEVVPPVIDSVSPPNGDEGTVVTVGGENFQDGATVMICGQEVPTTFISANEITFVAPPCPEGGPQDVTVINPDGGSDTLPGGFTYGAVGPPTAATLDPNWGPHAGGTEVIITGTNFVPGTTVTFGGVSTAVELASSTTLKVITPPSADPGPAPVVVDVVITTPGGSITLEDGFTYATPIDGDCDGDGMSDEDENFFGLDPCDPTGDNGPDGDPDGDGQKNGDEVNGDPPSHPRGFYKQYLAEGATGTFFFTEVGVVNASQTDAAGVLVTFFPEMPGGAVSLRYELEALQRTTVDVNAQFPGIGVGVSTLVESDRPVAATRQMTWDSSAYGSTLESGIPETSTTWLFAEGATYVFDLFYLLENSNREEANVTIQYLLGDGLPITQQIRVPASSRRTIWANGVKGLEYEEVAAVITSDLPIVAERAMYLSLGGTTWNAGQAGAGVTLPSTTWNFAEGATTFFDTFLLLGNQGVSPANVTVTYQLPDGATVVKQHTVPGQSRRTILIEKEDPMLEDTTVAMRVQSDQPILAERAMWWGPTSDSWYESHASLGTKETGTVWAFGEAATGGAYEEDTYLLVSNGTVSPGEVRVTLAYDDGTTEQKTFDLQGNARLTLLLTTHFPGSEGKRFSVLVESLGDPAVPITVDVSRYQSTNMIFGRAGGAALATKIR